MQHKVFFTGNQVLHLFPVQAMQQVNMVMILRDNRPCGVEVLGYHGFSVACADIEDSEQINYPEYARVKVFQGNRVFSYGFKFR